MSEIALSSNSLANDSEDNYFTFMDNLHAEMDANKNIHWLPILLSVISFASAGTLIRIIITDIFITTNIYKNNTIITASFATNIFGCLLLGIIENYSRLSFSLVSPIPNKLITKGLSTGLCGCITTFSSLNNELNHLIIHDKPEFGEFLMCVIVTYSTCITLYFFGKFIGSFLNYLHRFCKSKRRRDTNDNVNRQSINNNSNIVCKHSILFLLLFCLINGFCFMLSYYIHNKNEIYFSLILSPFGAGLRWLLGYIFNKQTWFPLGTFFANCLGSVLLTGLTGWNLNDKQLIKWIDAIMIGFCGSLTTVSTFVSQHLNFYREEDKAYYNFTKTVLDLIEYNKLSNIKKGLIYFIITLVFGQVLASIPNAIYEL
eukprot:29819_1